MMRPACAYPAIIQPGPPNGPSDIYGAERESFGMVPMQQLPSGQGFYSAAPLNVFNNPNVSTFSSQQASFSIPTYTSIQAQQVPYTNVNCVDTTPAGQMVSSFPAAQCSSQQYQQHFVAANGEKMLSNPSMMNSRGSTSSNGPPQTLPVAANMIPTQNSVPRMPSGNFRNRSTGASRSQVPVADSNNFQPQTIYASYQPGNPGSIPAGVSLSLAYSAAFPSQGIGSPIANKAGGQLVSAPSMPPQANVAVTRPSNLMPIPAQPSMFSAQSIRQPGFTGTGYSNQPRSGTITPQNISMMTRPPNDCSKDVQLGPNGNQVPIQTPCSTHSCSSPTSCSHFPGRGNRLNGPVFNQYIQPGIVGINSSMTPPAAGIVINGPNHGMTQTAMMTTINGCVAVGPEGDGKSISDGCFNIPTRPVSSGSRDLSMQSIPVSGQSGAGSELLISPTFPISNNLSSPVHLSYTTGNPQQISVFSGDFDSLSSNPSPMMMMAMPASSPVPGGTIINGPLQHGMMAPAPPPYHQTSTLMSCRPVCPSSFFGHPQLSGFPSSTAITAEPPGLPGTDRTFITAAASSNDALSTGKRTSSGTTKSTVRSKRSRTTKNTTGTGRGSKANSKKTSATAAAAAGPPTNVPLQNMIDPFGMNVRLSAQQQQQQQSGRSKPMSWTPQNGSAGFHIGLTSSPLTLSSVDSQHHCGSPVASFSSPTLMRPNSGPPVNAGYGSTIQGPGDACTRLPPSPRTAQSAASHCHGNFGVTQQQQQQMNAFRGPYSGDSQGNANSVYPGLSQPPCSRIPSGPEVIAGQPCTRTSGSNPPTMTDERLTAMTSASPGPGQNATEAPVNNYPGDTDRLVCPITNGMVWGPTQIQLTEIMQQFIPDGILVRRFEFDLTANHLNTIVGRSDLDIVVCSHLLNEPLQVCHWPSEAVQIRFNEYHLRLDRSSVNGGQSAHKVACVKQLCRPGRNQLEIAILGLGEDPNNSATMNKRRAIASSLETHRFAAFMAHMPALNVLLDGLKRRRPAGVNLVCDLLETRATASGQTDESAGSPVVGELNLVCPVFHTRMHVPGRITGCEHIEAFDMEAFLRREVLWPRLNCPICGHKSPAGLDGLCIDITILQALRLVPNHIDRILIRSDGHWRLPPPHSLDLPHGVDQWQPLIGPFTETVAHSLIQLNSTKCSLPNSVHPDPSPPSPSSKCNRLRSCSVDNSVLLSVGSSSVGDVKSRFHGSSDDSIKSQTTSRPMSQPVSWSELSTSASKLDSAPSQNERSTTGTRLSFNCTTHDVPDSSLNENRDRASSDDNPSELKPSPLTSRTTDRWSDLANARSPHSAPSLHACSPALSTKPGSDPCTSRTLSLESSREDQPLDQCGPIGDPGHESKSTSSLNKGLDYLLAEDHNGMDTNTCDDYALVHQSPAVNNVANADKFQYRANSIKPDEKMDVDRLVDHKRMLLPSEDPSNKRMKLDVDSSLNCSSEAADEKPNMDQAQLDQSSKVLNSWKMKQPADSFSDAYLYNNLHIDEENLSADAIQSLSAQIDHIDIFLDESYLNFVESFLCI